MTTWQEFANEQLHDGATAVTDTPGTQVASYGDPGAEYAALTDGLALVDRSYRGLLEVTGADRASWLHNLTTNEVKNLSSGEGNYAFCVNLRGRILFDLNVLVRPECIWLDIDRRYLPIARPHFDKYAIIEDVTVKDRSEEFVRFGLVGDAVKPWLAELGAPQAAAMPWLATADVERPAGPMTVLRHDFCGPFSVELFVPSSQAVAFWQDLLDESNARRAVPVGDDAVQIRRIEAGLPWSRQDITDEYLPAETGQFDRGVSFRKGCYLGQEVVERMRSRGALARRLVGLTLEGDDVPTPPVPLTDDAGRTVGTLTSACRSLTVGSVIALGYVKTDAASTGASLRALYGDREINAVVTDLPFVAGSPP